MREWKTSPLDQCLDTLLDYRGKSPPKSEKGIPVLSAKVVKTAGLLRPVEQKIAVDYYSKWMVRGLPHAGDVVMTTEAPLGEVIQLNRETAQYALGQRIVCLRSKPDKLDNKFLRYLLTSPAQQAILASYATGTTVLGISQKALRSVPITYPDFRQQQQIGELLGALDDKIELNRRMNETLEATARAIFKDWFVDFGPTFAKMEARAPYLAPDTWSLFSDRLDDEGKPEGWVSSTIGQEAEVVGGSTPSTKDAAFWGGDISWATPKDLSSLSTPVLLSTERQITVAGLSQIGSGLLPVGTVLLSSRAPIGYMAIAEVPVAVNQGFIAMICKKRLSNVFVWLWTQANMETVHQNANGSTFQEISKANFRPIEVTVAPPELLRAFDDTVKPLFDRIVSNEKEIRTLAATRDFLLPKLMSGEVRVDGAASLA